MRKLKLSLETLRVESFQVTNREATRRGTVQGHTGLPGCHPYEDDQVGTVVGACATKLTCHTGEYTMCDFTLWTCPPECYESS